MSTDVSMPCCVKHLEIAATNATVFIFNNVGVDNQ